jgi:hypothetical protein
MIDTLGDGSWCNAPHTRIRLFAFVDVELGWAWKAFNLEDHKWITDAERAGNEDDARALAEKWVRSTQHAVRYAAEFVWHRATDTITLMCGTCGKPKRIRYDMWYDWEREAAQSGSVHLCSLPRDGVHPRKECGGVLMKPLQGWVVPTD